MWVVLKSRVPVRVIFTRVPYYFGDPKREPEKKGQKGTTGEPGLPYRQHELEPCDPLLCNTLRIGDDFHTPLEGLLVVMSDLISRIAIVLTHRQGLAKQLL